MSEVADSSNLPVERDLSRAHWQRSVGFVVMNELADQFYDAEPYPIDEGDVEAINDRAYYMAREFGDYMWAKAAAVTSIFTRIGYREDVGIVNVPDRKRLHDQVAGYTHFSRATSAFEEGMDTMFTFPLKLASTASLEAENRGIKGFASNDLADIAGIMRRPDIHRLMHQAAFTRNAVWRGYATQASGSLDRVRDIPRPIFEFVDGEVWFTAEVSSYLTSELRDVNRDGLPGTDDRGKMLDVSKRPSSSCPVRHERAHFNDTQKDWNNLAMLAKFFGKTIDELLKPRPQTAISRGLDYTADMLDRAHPYFPAAT